MQLITVKKVQRRRPKVVNSDMQKDREVTNEYNLLTEDHPTKIPGCTATFCSVLGEFNFDLRIILFIQDCLLLKRVDH